MEWNDLGVSFDDSGKRITAYSIWKVVLPYYLILLADGYCFDTSIFEDSFYIYFILGGVSGIQGL